MINLSKEIEDLKLGKVLLNVDYSEITTYKLDGIAKCLIEVKTVSKLIDLIKYLKEKKILYKIIGNGSNLIFKNKEYNGVLIKLAFDDLKLKDTVIEVGAGYNLMKLALKVANLGLTGLEFAAGIPGTIGGAIFMNAGAYKSDMGYIVSKIEVLTPELTIKTLYNKDLDFHYRTSFLQKNPDYICLKATIVLKLGDKKAIKDLMAERKRKRLMTQPLEFPSAGSVFRNPGDIPAGKIIEDLGLKGYRIGDALVSEKHANFIINLNKATGNDIIKLINHIKEKVKKEMNIDLKCEQEIVE